MAEIIHPFRCEILTPDGVSESMEAAGVVFPASDGQMGVLGGRAPLLAMIGAGPLTVEETTGRKLAYFIAGGFARMNEDLLTILAEECVPVEQLDPETIWGQIQQAHKLPRQTQAQIDRREEALHIAQTKFALAQKRRQQRTQRHME